MNEKSEKEIGGHNFLGSIHTYVVGDPGNMAVEVIVWRFTNKANISHYNFNLGFGNSETILYRCLGHTGFVTL